MTKHDMESLRQEKQLEARIEWLNERLSRKKRFSSNMPSCEEEEYRHDEEECDGDSDHD